MVNIKQMVKDYQGIKDSRYARFIKKFGLIGVAYLEQNNFNKRAWEQATEAERNVLISDMRNYIKDNTANSVVGNPFLTIILPILIDWVIRWLIDNWGENPS